MLFEPIPSSIIFDDNFVNNDDEYLVQTTGIVVSAIAIIFYITLNSLREFVLIYQQKWHYILEAVNMISWILYVSAVIMISPVLFGDNKVANIHYSAASITVFFSWFRLLLFLQRFDQVYIHIHTYINFENSNNTNFNYFFLFLKAEPNYFNFHYFCFTGWNLRCYVP